VTAGQRPPTRVLLAVGNPGREQRLRNALSRDGLVVARRPPQRRFPADRGRNPRRALEAAFAGRLPVPLQLLTNLAEA
jgi:hypothetical protein